jgi:hypothetical protein
MKKSAETLKNEMRQQIEILRGKFRRLLGINDQLPLDLKIPRQVNPIFIFIRIKNQILFVEFYSR